MKNKILKNIANTIKRYLISVASFLNKHKVGFIIISLFTIIYFLPLIMKIGTYMDMGDSMFNAWTLARDQNCILGNNCPNYLDANIFYPNKDSMLYSETQLSAGLLTLPLRIFTDNPIVFSNVWTILSMLFAGYFMYLLAKRLSGNNETISVISALIFAFAPTKIYELTHLQNLSIFYLPLIFLAIIRFMDTKKRRYLVLFLVATTLLFYASWYQMVFVAMAICLFLITSFLTKYIRGKDFASLFLVFMLAFTLTLPLAKDYISFSKRNNASFSTANQIEFSNSIKDFFIPYRDTLAGSIYHNLFPSKRTTPYNGDNTPYVGITLVLVGLIVIITSIFLKRKKKKEEIIIKNHKLILGFIVIGIAGLIFSLGPVIKFGSNFSYTVQELSLMIPAPWLIAIKILPQLNFIRAIGRMSIIFLFALCCLLSFAPILLKKININQIYKVIFSCIILVGLIVELCPTSLYTISTNEHSYHKDIPKIYNYIKESQTINNIIILRSEPNYKTADGYSVEVKFEDVLWAGYHNKNIFNGLSGYTPPLYNEQYNDFVDFHEDDIPKLKTLGIQYIIVDSTMTNEDSSLAKGVANYLGQSMYNDGRYYLYKLE